MPPVINTPDKHPPKPSGSSSGPHPSTIQRKSDLLCRVKWNNTLPDIPFDPKFITYPFDSDRFTKYKATSLEKEFKHDLLTEHDLGVAIDLINPDAYGPTPIGAGRDPDDERLLEDESQGLNTTPGHHNLSEKRSRQHNKVVPWLKKTEYISTEFNRYGASSENNETKVGYNVQKKFKEVRESMICMDREGQISAINRTFEEAKKPITQHHSKKGVIPVEILPVFPDFDHWKIPFAQVSFDAEPVAPSPEAEKLMCEAMIRGVMDESGEQFVAYFLPTPETLQKRQRDAENGIRYDPEDQYEYKQTREYTWSVKNKSTRGYDQNYFFVIRDGALYYDELETRVRLTKRRNKSGPATNSKLVITHREPNESELRTQQVREHQLKPNVDDDDNVVDEEEDTKKNIAKIPSRETSPEKGDKKNRKRKSSASSSSSSSSSGSGSGSSSSGSGSSSESDDEDAAAKAKKAKKDAEEIFGSDDSS